MKSHDNLSKSFRCQYCHYMFRRQSHLTRHVLIHTGEKPFKCNQCDERFSRSDKLKLHVSRTHCDPASTSTPTTGKCVKARGWSSPVQLMVIVMQVYIQWVIIPLIADKFLFYFLFPILIRVVFILILTFISFSPPPPFFFSIWAICFKNVFTDLY